MAGIYVHFPFCASRCIYCDFYSRVRKDWTEYAEALERELIQNSDYFRGVPPRTLYFGGGTPSLLPANLLSEVAECARKTFGVDNFEEFTIEANPDDVTPESVRAWKKMGVNRVSMGVQSFDDGHLRWMRRRHSAAQVSEAVAALRAEDMTEFSIDLIFGFTGLSHEQWDANINAALALCPPHISCYQMTGRWAHESEELCHEQYLHLQRRLEDAGYEHYEVSNYALKGHRSRHNSAYWDRTAYLGIGAAAHSFDGIDTRRWNVADIDRYIAGEKAQSEVLSAREAVEEMVMLSLRTSDGLELSSLPDEIVCKMKPALSQMARTGNLILEGDTVVIPSDKLFISDWIISRLIVD